MAVYLIKDRILWRCLYEYPFGTEEIRVVNTFFIKCNSKLGAGAIFIDSSSAFVNISMCDIYQCYSSFVGGIYIGHHKNNVKIDKICCRGLAAPEYNSLKINYERLNTNTSINMTSIDSSIEKSHEFFIGPNNLIDSMNCTIRSNNVECIIAGKSRISNSVFLGGFTYALQENRITIESCIFGHEHYEKSINFSISTDVQFINSHICWYESISISQPESVSFIDCVLSVNVTGVQMSNCSITIEEYPRRSTFVSCVLNNTVYPHNDEEKSGLFEEKLTLSDYLTYTIRGSEFHDIESDGEGGAISVNSIKSIRLIENTFSCCKAEFGGALMLKGINLQNFTSNCFFECKAYKYSSFYYESCEEEIELISVIDSGSPYSLFSCYAYSEYASNCNITGCDYPTAAAFLIMFPHTVKYSCFSNMICPETLINVEISICNSSFVNISSYCANSYVLSNPLQRSCINTTFYDVSISIYNAGHIMFKGITMSNCFTNNNSNAKEFQLIYKKNFNENDFNRNIESISCFKYVSPTINEKSGLSELDIILIISGISLAITTIIILLSCLVIRKKLSNAMQKTEIEQAIVNEFG